MLKKTSHLSLRPNGSQVDLSYNLEAEIEVIALFVVFLSFLLYFIVFLSMFELCLHFQVICVPDFDDFPFNRHTCHVNVSHYQDPRTLDTHCVIEIFR